MFIIKKNWGYLACNVIRFMMWLLGFLETNDEGNCSCLLGFVLRNARCLVGFHDAHADRFFNVIGTRGGTSHVTKQMIKYVC